MEIQFQGTSGCELSHKQLMPMMERVARAGVVHWAPPEGALDLAAELIRDKGISAYGPCAGTACLGGCSTAEARK